MFKNFTHKAVVGKEARHLPLIRYALEAMRERYWLRFLNRHYADAPVDFTLKHRLQSLLLEWGPTNSRPQYSYHP